VGRYDPGAPFFKAYIPKLEPPSVVTPPRSVRRRAVEAVLPG